MSDSMWCGQFNIVGGAIQEEGPFVGIFEGARQASGVGIYVLVEPIGSATPRLCDEVIEAVARGFGTPEPALTANLLRGISAGHQHVREWNRLHASDRSAGVGISCLAVRDGEGYLAQCGPSLAIAHTMGRFRVAAPTGDDSRRPLGIGAQPAPVFSRFTFNPHDIILLTFSAADRLIDRGTLISLVNAPPEEALPALYVRVRSAENFGGLYLATLAEESAAEAASAAPSRVAVERSVAAERRVRADPSVERRPATGTRVAVPTEERAGRNGHRPGEGRTAIAGARTLPRRTALGSLGERTGLPSGRLLLALLIICVIAVLLFFAVPALARRGNNQHFQDLIHSADAKLAAAQSQSDVGQRRTLLDDAEADLLEAKAMQPGASDVTDRLARVDNALAAMDGVRQLSGIADVADLAGAAVAPQAPIELAVAGGVYLLDASAGKVLSFPAGTAARPDTVFEEGRTIGSQQTGKAAHLAVVPGKAGTPGTLLVLDANRRLFARSPDGAWSNPALPGADAWKDGASIAATVDALYILDAAGERIWRYDGTPAGYTNRPDPLVTDPALRSATDISVAGVPVVATSDSRLLRIADGRAQELQPNGLDRPLSGPSAPLFNAADSSLYVADRGNRRIVVLDANGAFKGQLVHPRLTALRALALDDAHATIYAVSGQSLLSAPLSS